MFSTALARDLKYISNETYLERLASVNTPAPNSWLLDQEGEIYKDSSLAGLAKILGVDDQRLARTLDDYNRAIGSNNLSALNIPRTGKPRPLRAPFYGLRVVPVTFTMGGILVNGRAQVLNEDEKPFTASTLLGTPSAG